VLIALVASIYVMVRSQATSAIAVSGTDPIEVVVHPVDVQTNADGSATATLLLQEKSGDRRIRMNLDLTEALSIARDRGPRLAGQAPEAYELTSKSIQSMGGRVERVIVNDADQNSYHAQIVLSNSTATPIVMDARPGDAIALAVRAGAPVYVENRVLDMASSTKR
jgi:bifunctional DNase/RNase